MSTLTSAKNLLDLSGRVAVVTGGTRGIGEAIVRPPRRRRRPRRGRQPLRVRQPGGAAAGRRGDDAGGGRREEGRGRPHGRDGRRAPRDRRRPRQLRGHGEARAGARAGGGRLGVHDRAEPQGHRVGLPRGGARHAAGRPRPHREHHVHRRRVRARQPGGLLRDEGGGGPAHALPRARVGPARDHRERGRPRDHGDAARAAVPRRQPREGGDDDAQDPARAARAGRTTWRARSPSWRRTWRRTSPGRPSTSTAGGALATATGEAAPRDWGPALRAIPLGHTESVRKTVGESDVYLFAGITGDFSGVHVDEEFCEGHAVRRAHRPRRAPRRLRLHGDGADDRAPAAPGRRLLPVRGEVRRRPSGSATR